MAIIFAGALPHEFTNAPLALSTIAGRFDPDYAPGAINRAGSSKFSLKVFDDTATEFWVHAKCFIPSYGSGNVYNGGGSPIFMAYASNGDPIGGLACVNTSYLTAIHAVCGGVTSTYSTQIMSLIPKGELFDLDFHCWYVGTTLNMDLFINGIAAVTGMTRGSYGDRLINYCEIGSPHPGDSFFSEIIVTSGNDQTVGWHLHSKDPDPAAPGINTFNSGIWGSLATSDTGDGVVTDTAGARITGQFMDYTGPATPIGIRAVVQSARFIKNGASLSLRGQLRASAVNYDLSDAEFVDETRVLTVWEENPVTSLPWQVADLDAIEGGFTTVAV